MKSWGVGFVLGFLFLNNALVTPQPLSAFNALVGVFLWLVILVNWYGKK
jgi:hypothetical protein